MVSKRKKSLFVFSFVIHHVFSPSAFGADPSPLLKGLQSDAEGTPVLPGEYWSTFRTVLAICSVKKTIFAKRTDKHVTFPFEARPIYECRQLTRRAGFR